MCILLCTVSHPDYALILGSNRDEFFSRPTQRAELIEGKYLMPVDLAREEHGTWIGVSKTNRICVLVNFRENKNPCQIGGISRGLITKDFLESELDPISWANDIKIRSNNFKDIGGFSLLFGILNNEDCSESLYVISNRVEGILKPFIELTESEKHKVLGLSNSSIFQPWPKVSRGKKLINDMLNKPKANSTDEIIEEMLNIMCDQYEGIHYGESMKETIIDIVPKTVFVPALKNDITDKIELLQGSFYGTRTQTVILLSRDGKLTYVERDIQTMHDINNNIIDVSSLSCPISSHISKFQFQLT